MVRKNCLSQKGTLIYLGVMSSHFDDGPREKSPAIKVLVETEAGWWEGG